MIQSNLIYLHDHGKIFLFCILFSIIKTKLDLFQVCCQAGRREQATGWHGGGRLTIPRTFCQSLFPCLQDHGIFQYLLKRTRKIFNQLSAAVSSYNKKGTF